MISAKGVAAFSADAPLERYAFQRRAPGPHDVLIDIKFCGICHSDIHTVRGEWGGARYPVVPGHEIAGVVRAVGDKVTRFKIGDRAGVGCFVDSCRECEACKNGEEQYCLRGMTGTYNDMERDGSMPTQGGYSDVIVVNENYTLRIPDALPLDKAAPLLCAGITLYSPLKHWKAGLGKKVAILGLGGLGHMGVKLAVAMGADVTVLSHSEKKREDALRMGAHHFVSTGDKAIFKQYANHFDLIINTVSADLVMGHYLGLLKLDGTMVLVGLPDKPLTLPPFALVNRRRSLAGSLIGGIRETQEMLDFCAQHGITPDIETVAPGQINAAYERVVKSDVRYRFVIDTSQL